MPTSAQSVFTMGDSRYISQIRDSISPIKDGIPTSAESVFARGDSISKIGDTVSTFLGDTSRRISPTTIVILL